MIDLAGWVCIVLSAHVGLSWAHRRGIGASNPIWAELVAMGAGLVPAAVFVWAATLRSV